MKNLRLKFLSFIGKVSNKDILNALNEDVQPKFKMKESHKSIPSIKDTILESIINIHGIRKRITFQAQKKEYNTFIHNICNESKIKKKKAQNYLSQLRGYKDKNDEIEFKKIRDEKSKEILNLRKRKELLDKRKLIPNYKELYSCSSSYLNNEKNISKSESQLVKEKAYSCGKSLKKVENFILWYN